jgi:hypothetical protein
MPDSQLCLHSDVTGPAPLSTGVSSVKRPIPVYFVAAWCFLALLYQASGLLDQFKPQLPEGQASEGWWASLRILIDILVIWHIVRLVQLKWFNRWLSVVFFVLWTIVMAWNWFVLAPKFHNPLRVVASLSAYGVLNVASAWYLSRPGVRRFAVEFVAERTKEKHLRDMQRISQKKVHNEAKS